MKQIAFLLFFACFVIACTSTGTGHAGNESANKKRVQEFYDQVINAHNVDMIDSFTHADFLDHNPDPGFTGKGSEELKKSFGMFFAAFPDARVNTDFMLASGDTVVAYLTMTGTNSGPMGPGMPATNKSTEINGIDIVVIKDGKAIERWGVFDIHNMMMDLGMMGGPTAEMDTTHVDTMNQ